MSTIRGSPDPNFYAGLLPVEPSHERPPLRPTNLEYDPSPKGQPSLRKTSFARPLPFPDDVLLGCSRYLGLAVVWRCSETDDRKLVPVAELVGAASRTGGAEPSQHDRTRRARHPFFRSAAAQRNVAQYRRDTAKHRQDRRGSRTDNA